MQFVCIGVEGSTGTLMQHLNSELVQLKKEKVDYSLEQIDKDGSTSIVCSINDDNYYNEKSVRSYRALKVRIAHALADYIIRQYEEKLILRTINSNYCYFNAAEKRDILNNVLKMIENSDKNGQYGLFKIRRRNIIIRKLLDYFESTNSLILDGFVNFRLKDYIKDLEEIVDKAVDDYLMDREYKEFIRLLRYFVDIQEPKADVIHVIAGYNCNYMLLDQSKKEITNECIQEFISEVSDGEINYDDLLVSSLITFAPRKIVIHCDGQIKNKELLETIKNVFSGKVVICNGCELCLVNVVKTEK
ncbi:MAG TPA: putative sporulation protein YtxC [Clostridiaceae bacterium]|nr:putative sporulation protein YtxC [Clostridiaceae bacterium]